MDKKADIRLNTFNIVSVVFGQLISVILGLVVPRLFITSLGSEVNGILSTIGQIYVYVGLLEAGIGTTTLQALYKPIGENNKEGVNAILNATKYYYKRTSLYYGICVILFAIFYPLITNSSLDYVTLFLVILLQGMGSLVNFLFQGRFKLLLIADGRGYISNLINTGTSILNNLSKIILIAFGYDVIVVYLTMFFIMVLQMSVYYIYLKRKYDWLSNDIVPDLNSLNQKNAVLIHQISSLVFSNTDIIILSFACGYKTVSVYYIYNLIFTILSDTLANANASILHVFGKLFYKDKKGFVKYQSIYEDIYYIISFAVFTVASIMIIPFLKLYVGSVTDINYIDSILAFLFVVMKMLVVIRVPCNNVINVAGHFDATKNRSIIESIINVSLTILFVWKFGIYGAVLGTIVALLYRTTDIILYSHKNILFTSAFTTYKKIFINSITFVLIVYFYSKLDVLCSSYISFVITAIQIFATVFSIFVIVNLIFHYKEMKKISKKIYCWLFNVLNNQDSVK